MVHVVGLNRRMGMELCIPIGPKSIPDFVSRFHYPTWLPSYPPFRFPPPHGDKTPTSLFYFVALQRDQFPNFKL